MSNITTIKGSRDLSTTVLSDFIDDDDLDSGVFPSLATLAIRGSKFRLRFNGEEELIKEADGSPKQHLDVVILKATAALQKRYYANDFVEGENSAPSCFSMDGVRPDPTAENPQNDVCASCKWNALGTAKMGNGKACSDSRRVAFVPRGNLQNDRFGGPVLLVVPAMSLKSLSNINPELRRQYGRIGYNEVVTRLSFDPSTSYPRLVFTPVAKLDNEDRAIIADHYRSGAVARVLQDKAELEKTPQAFKPAPAPVSEPEPVQEPAQEPEPEPAKPTRTRRKKVAAKAAAAPVPEPEEVMDDDESLGVEMASDELDDSLDGLFD